MSSLAKETSRLSLSQDPSTGATMLNQVTEGLRAEGVGAMEGSVGILCLSFNVQTFLLLSRLVSCSMWW